MRSASLASMSLMFAADEQGLSTGVVGGFDTEAVRSAFNLPSSILPVMLVTVGYPTAGNWPQKLRKPLQEVLEII
ncbi:nitroreductase family protein [Photobacterium alginatilyticum]|uniref:nitroreductase family protein n=1 Tax=Photobacterium alginatilyticum TaxID=1775171 RepID=UPI004068FC2B